MVEEPLQHQAHADLIVSRAAEQLRVLLKQVAAGIRPFPEFPGSFYSYGIEVDVPAVASGDDRGCVVLGEDGALYELQVGLDVEQVAGGDPAAMRIEARVPLDELAPADFVAYAHRAVSAAVEYSLRQQAERDDATRE